MDGEPRRRTHAWEATFFETVRARFPESTEILAEGRIEWGERLDADDAIFFLARELLRGGGEPADRLLAFADELLASDDELARDVVDPVVGRLILEPALRERMIPESVEEAIQAEFRRDEHLTLFVPFVDDVRTHVPELRPALERAFILASGLVLTTLLLDFLSTELLERMRRTLAGDATELGVVTRWLAVVETWISEPAIWASLSSTFVEDVVYCDELGSWRDLAGPNLRAGLDRFASS